MKIEGKVIVVGAGGVGFWLSLALSRSGVAHTVYDTDTLEGGLGYSRMPKASPSTRKTTLLRGHTLAVMGDRAPAVVEALFTGYEAGTGDLVIDCSDMDIGVRRGIWAIAKERGARLLRVSYDGKNGTVVVAEGLPLAGRKGGGYADVPNLALSFMAGGMGALAVIGLLKGDYKHIEFQVAMAELLGVVAEEPVIEIKAEEPLKPKRRSRAKATTQEVKEDVQPQAEA